MTYSEFVSALRNLGPFQQARAAELLFAQYNAYRELEQLLLPNRAGERRGEMVITKKEQEEEAALLSSLRQGQAPGAIGDGTMLREVFQFVKENPLILLLFR
jgi:hypothetical protein